MQFPVTEHTLKAARHTMFYLACGPDDGPLMIFVHGWPELSISWRNQLPVFAALGFRCLAPDMRGYGRSTVHTTHEAYAVEHSVTDLLALLDATGRERATWVGHDWGSPVVWAIASHHPDRCHGVANLCVPYFAEGFAAETVMSLIDRTVYPVDEFPAGQWDYQLYYRENFAAASHAFEANTRATVKALFRRGNPAARGKPSRTATMRRDGGWFGGSGVAPDLPLDETVLSLTELESYVASLERNGFFGPASWYMNPTANTEYARCAVNNGRLAMPVLFLHGAYDYTCETMDSRLAEPMRAFCNDLTEVVVQSGHWMAQEQPVAVNQALARWLATKLPHVWGTQP